MERLSLPAFAYSAYSAVATLSCRRICVCPSTAPISFSVSVRMLGEGDDRPRTATTKYTNYTKNNRHLRIFDLLSPIFDLPSSARDQCSLVSISGYKSISHVPRLSRFPTSNFDLPSSIFHLRSSFLCVLCNAIAQFARQRRRIGSGHNRHSD